jgi:phage terminase small subunit
MPENLTPRQRKAIESLLTTGDITDAAKAAGVSRDTLYRWMKDDLFQEALQKGTQQAIDGLSRSLMQLGDQAIKTLRDAMTDKMVVTSTKIRAANITLVRMLQLKELADVEARLAKLEEAVHEKSR